MQKIRSIHIISIGISLCTLLIYGFSTYKNPRSPHFYTELFHHAQENSLTLSSHDIQTCLSILEKCAQQSFEAGQLILFDGAPAIGQCHLIAQKVAQFYQQYQAHCFHPSPMDKALLTLTFFTSNSFPQSNRLTSLKALFPDLAEHITFTRFFNAEKLQEAASQQVAKILITYLKEEAKKRNDPLSHEIQQILQLHTLIMPKLITGELFLRSLETVKGAPLIVIKTKIMCSQGHHIALLYPSKKDHHYEVQHTPHLSNQPVIMVEGFSCTQTITPSVYNELQKACPYTYKIDHHQKTHDLKERCQACSACPHKTHCFFYQEVIKKLQTYTPRSLIMPLAADFVDLYEKSQKELLICTNTYPYLKQLFYDQLQRAHTEGLSDTHPSVFSIRHIYPILMSKIDYTQRYIDTRISTLLQTIIL